MPTPTTPEHKFRNRSHNQRRCIRVKALRSFLLDAGIPDELAIEDAVAVRRSERLAVSIRLQDVSAQLLASTHFAETARNEYHAAAQEARSIAGEVRERETLLTRLKPLRSQYADDLRKLGLLEESRCLFDALSVRVCPACQTRLTVPVDVTDGHCTLCHSPVEHLRHHLLDTNGQTPMDTGAVSDGAVRIDDEGADVAIERRSVSRRLNKLKNFIADVTGELTELGTRLGQAQGLLDAAQQRLDATTSAVIAPFMTERDQLTGQLAAADGALASLASSRSLLAQVAERERDQGRISAALALAKERQRELERSRRSRDQLIARLSRRFEQTLADFAFPKLSDAYLNRALVPSVRGQRYERIGSSGAMTLLALAWQLTIFEEAVERGHGHPGFLLIDSPQKNLRPGTAATIAADSDPDIALQAATIVDRVYAHIIRWSEAHPRSGQIILVDNEPPARAANVVAVRYSGSIDDPPYGLIEDATD